VHHGGSGTTHSALRFDIPQLIIPHIADQFLWMRLIVKNNMGPAGFPIKNWSREKFDKGVRALLKLD
jgi:sterol 3beta-glucosyltransferase